MAAKTIKMCDMNIEIAMKVFEMLNPGKVKVQKKNILCTGNILITDVEPKDLVYPEGWYYAKGCFRNKYTSTTGFYSEAILIKSNGEFWKNEAIYCTSED